MDTNTLNENQRKQLDMIVHQMTLDGRRPAEIKFVVDDFKSKYATPTQEDRGFFGNLWEGTKNVVKDIVGIEQNKSTSLIPSLIQSTIGSKGLAGIAQLPGRVIDVALNPNEVPNITARQALGTTINAGLTAATGGGGSLASRFGLKGGKALATRVAENAAIGAGFQVGANLTDNRPTTENVGLSATIGGLLPIAGVGLQKLKQTAAPTAERVINSLIKPLSKDFAYGKNPARGILNEGIIANSFDDLGRKVEEKISLVGKGIGAVGQELDRVGVTLDLTPALTPIDKAIQEAAKANNTTLFNNLNNVKTALLNELTVGADDKGVASIVKGAEKNLIGAGYKEAVQFLSDISTHTRFTGNISDDKALNMATKKAYGITREIMNNAADSVDPAVGKQIRNLNERYADLLSARNAISHRDIVLKRQNFLDLAQRFSIPVTILGGLLTGNWTTAGKILLTELAIKGAGSTASKTRIAQFLSRLAPAERQGILNSTPVLKNWYERVTGKVSPGEEAPKTKSLKTVETIGGKINSFKESIK